MVVPVTRSREFVSAKSGKQPNCPTTLFHDGK